MKREYIKIFYYKNKGIFFSAVIFDIILTCLSVGSACLLQLLLDVTNRNDLKNLQDILILSVVFFILLFFTQMLLRKTRCTFIKRAMIQYKQKAFEQITKKNISSFARENTNSYISILN